MIINNGETLDILCEMFLGEQMMSRSHHPVHHPVHAPVHAGSTPDPDHYRSVSQGSTQVPSIMSHSVQSSDRARAHVQKEVQKLIKTCPKKNCKIFFMNKIKFSI